MEATGYEGGAEGLLTLAETQDSTLPHVIPPATSVTLSVSVGRNMAVLHVFQAREPATARGVSLHEFLIAANALTQKLSGCPWPRGEAGPQGRGRSSTPLRPSHPTATCPLLPIQ